MAQSETSPVSTLRRGPPRCVTPSRSQIMAMAGEYDVATVGALSERFSAAIALDETDLVVDIREVSFMDAATISVIIRAKVFLGEHDRLLFLRDPSPCARRILGICDLNSMIEPEAGSVEPRSFGALESWVAVPPTVAARDRLPRSPVIPAANPTAAEVTTEPVLASVGAAPTASRSYAASSLRGRW